MADAKVTPVDALTQVLEALRPLTSDERGRVMAAVEVLFGSSSRGAIVSTPVQDELCEEGFVRPGAPGVGVPSPKQFLMSKRPKTDVDRIACLAFYLSQFRSQVQFKTVDLSALNSEAALPKLSNAAYATENAVKSGLLVSSGGGQKQMAAVGEIYVQNLPDYDAARRALNEHRHSRKRKSR